MATVRKDIRPEETCTLLSPTLNKHNHCSPQRHTIWLLHFLLSSWPQSAKTYDRKKHVLSYLLHLTNTIIAVRKDHTNIALTIFCCHRGHSLQRHTTGIAFRCFLLVCVHLNHNHCSPQRHTIWLLHFLLSSWPAVREDIRPEETCTLLSPTLNKHNHCSQIAYTYQRQSLQSAKTYNISFSDCPYVCVTTHNSLQSAKTYNIAFRFSLFFVAAVRKDIRPEETFSVRCPIREKHTHCSPQRHTILLLDFLFSS